MKNFISGYFLGWFYCITMLVALVLLIKFLAWAIT